ncbi:hypothetical protein BDL97_01G053200 [Sphagnum fallax]|nr:hypothetical protein BDL97_01G053200 [Sphagnum fallax]
MNVLELFESLKRQHKGTGGGILLRKNGTTTEEGDEETAEKMVGRMLQFQQASSPLVNVGLGLLGVQTPLVCDTVSRFLVDSLASVLWEISFWNWWRIGGAFSTMVASLALAPDLLAEAGRLLCSWFLSVNRYSHQKSHFPPNSAIEI